jgi:hypothetical protein
MKLALAGIPLLLVACAASPEVDAIPVTPVDGPPKKEEPAKPNNGDDGDVPFCSEAQGIYTAKRETSNVMLLIDRSGSMHIKLSNADTRWTGTKKGLANLLRSLPATSRAGAMMFPQGDKPITCCGIDPALNDVKCSCASGELPGTTTRCAASHYEAGVPVAPLDTAQITAIEAHVASADREFYWGTPLATGLQAALDRMMALKVEGPKSVVLLTDGIPTSCDTASDPQANDVARVVAAATKGAQAGVRTFVMGVIDGTKGARAESLQQIAAAGGTGTHYAINAQTFAQDIKAAFDKIALEAFDCTFELPDPAMGAEHDLSKVNVVIKGSSGDHALSRDTTHQGGWDYLGGRIQIYGAACAGLKADPGARVDVVVGCKTVGR